MGNTRPLDHSTNGPGDPVFENLKRLKATYRPGQQWQFQSGDMDPGQWLDLTGAKEPGWFFDTKYRIKPEGK